MSRRKTSTAHGEQDDLRKITALLRAKIKTTKFDRSGLRIHQLPLITEELDFKEIPKEMAQQVAEWEYSRELAANYPDHGRLLPYLWSAFFPLSFREIENLWGEKIRTNTDKIGAFSEIDQDWLAAGMTTKKPELAFHSIRLDWSRGAEAILVDFEKWIRGQSSSRTAKRRRPSSKIHQDRLDQLAAWRAHRAGLSHVHFLEYDVRCPYADASAFRNAWKQAEKTLLSLSKR